MIFYKKEYLKLKEKYDKIRSKKAFIRRMLNSVDLNSIDIDSRKDRLDFLAEMEQIQDKKHFHVLINELMKYQNQEGLSSADTQEKLDFARGTLNGISLVSEFVEKFSSQYREETKTEEDFDKYSIL